MADIIFITGGARSGKSSYAESKAAEFSDRVLYLATAVGFDEEMRQRIRKHRADRPKTWRTMEKFEKFSEIPSDPDFIASEVILLDCLSLMLNNRMYYSGIDFESRNYEQFELFEEGIGQDLESLISMVRAAGKKLIMVSNEIGMGIVPIDALSRQYRDMLGRINKQAARTADEVYLLVSGIPVKIK